MNLRILCIAICLLVTSSAPGFGRDGSTGPTRDVQYPGVTVVTYAAPPLRVTIPRPNRCSTGLCVPESVVVTNVSNRRVVRAWVSLIFPEVTLGGRPYGINATFNTDVTSSSNPDEGLEPNETVTLAVDPERVAIFERHLASRGLSVASLSRIDVLVTNVDFGDGSSFSPAGYAAE